MNCKMGCLINRTIQECIGTVHEIGHMDGVIRRTNGFQKSEGSIIAY
jgi:hypothetical protein